MWCLQESNQGHKDFQSFALPTELRHQPHLWGQRYKLNLIYNDFFYFFSKNVMLYLFYEISENLNRIIIPL
jgi:hypothetical protein